MSNNKKDTLVFFVSFQITEKALNDKVNKKNRSVFIQTNITFLFENQNMRCI